MWVDPGNTYIYVASNGTPNHPGMVVRHSNANYYSDMGRSKSYMRWKHLIKREATAAAAATAQPAAAVAPEPAAAMEDVRQPGSQNAAADTSTKEPSDLASLLASLGSCKTANLEKLKKYIKTYLSKVHSRIAAFAASRKMRKLRWHQEIMRQRALDMACKKLVKAAGTSNIIVAYGDGLAAASFYGRAPSPKKSLRKCMERHVQLVVDVDERYTSMLCCKCHEPMQGLKLERKEGQRQASRSYAVRVCFNTAHAAHTMPQIWNRDVNGCLNIGYLGARLVNGEPRPDAFNQDTRQQRQQRGQARRQQQEAQVQQAASADMPAAAL